MTWTERDAAKYAHEDTSEMQGYYYRASDEKIYAGGPTTCGRCAAADVAKTP